MSKIEYEVSLLTAKEGDKPLYKGCAYSAVCQVIEEKLQVGKWIFCDGKYVDSMTTLHEIHEKAVSSLGLESGVKKLSFIVSERLEGGCS